MVIKYNYNPNMATTNLVRGQTTKILVLNPNSSQAMTEGMKSVINAVDLPPSTEIHTYTAPASSPASINDGTDIAASTEAVLTNIHSVQDSYDGILVACFSVHPLVQKLQAARKTPGSVTGIFESSIVTAMTLLEEGQKWGVVTTGKFWEQHLSDGVKHFIGAKETDNNTKFAGVESTGLNAGDFHHGVSPEVVREKLKAATKRLLAKGDVTVIVMGCAGMAGLEENIRSAAAEEKGEAFAYEQLHVVDGVRAGIMLVDTAIKHQRLRRRPTA